MAARHGLAQQEPWLRRPPLRGIMPGCGEVVALIVDQVTRVGYVGVDHVGVEEAGDGGGGDRDFGADPRVSVGGRLAERGFQWAASAERRPLGEQTEDRITLAVLGLGEL